MHSISLKTPAVRMLAVAAAATIALVGCSSAESQPVETPAETTITAPARIAALDYESAETIAELGLADHLVLIPEAVLNPALGGHIEELAQVEETIPVAMEMSAETIIAMEPDLVVMSPRHGADETVGTVLEQSGLETLVLPETWSSVDSMLTNIELIGAATGTDAQASELIKTLEAGLTPGEPTESETAKPRVLVLTNQAGTPFATGGSALPLELLELSGATSVSDELGLRHTGPISAEQVLEANPDGIVMIDMNGTGDRMYASLLSNPAVAALPAISEDHMLRIEGRNVQAMGLTSTIEGLESLKGWVSQLR